MSMKNNRKMIRMLAYLGITTSMALILSWVEHLLPPIYSAIPGIKIGLPNIVIIFLLYRFGWREAAAVSLVRILIVSMLFGTPMTLAYSLAGGVLSLGIMILLKKLNFLSCVGVSVAGGVFHNIGQILMAVILLGTAEIAYYLIVLAVTGTVAGIFVGLAGGLLNEKVPKLKL